MTDEKANAETVFGYKKCHVCAVPLVNDPADIRKHLGDHAHHEKQLEAIRRDHIALRQQVATAKDAAAQARRDSADLLRELNVVRNETAPSEALHVAELTDDEIDAYTPDEGPTSTYPDDQQDDAQPTGVIHTFPQQVDPDDYFGDDGPAA